MQSSETIRLQENGRTYLIASLLKDRVLYQKWQGKINDDSFRSGMDAIGDLLARYSVKALVVDAQQSVRATTNQSAYAYRVLSSYIKGQLSKKYPGQVFHQVFVLPTSDQLMKSVIDKYSDQFDQDIKIWKVDKLETAWEILGLEIPANNQILK